jgi:DNA-damage-inducible protein J
MEIFMRTDTVVRARIPIDTKDKAVSALQQMGLSVSDLIRLVFFRVAEEGRVPFAVEVPNAATRAAMAEMIAGGGQTYESAEAMFKDLDIVR